MTIPKIEIKTIAPSLSIASPVAPSQTGISELILGFRGANILFAAIEVDLFEKLGHGTKSLSELNASLKLNRRALELALDALVSLKFLTKKNSAYGNAEITKNFILRDSPKSLYFNLLFQAEMVNAWGKLPNSLKTGKPFKGLEKKLSGKDFTKRYIYGMHELSRILGPSLSDAMSSLKIRKFLDVGTGPGTYAAAILNQFPESKAVLMDLASTLKITKGMMRQFNPRVVLRAGNYKTTDYGDREFDLVLLSHVIHDESEKDTMTMLRKAYRALKPGGTVAIHDFMLSDDRTAPLFGALFSVHLLTYTGGRTYTESECRKWLKAVGFEFYKRSVIGMGSPNESILMLAQRPPLNRFNVSPRESDNDNN